MTHLTLDAAAGEDDAPAAGNGIGVRIRKQLDVTEVSARATSPDMDDDVAITIEAEDGTTIELLLREQDASDLAGDLGVALGDRARSVEV